MKLIPWAAITAAAIAGICGGAGGGGNLLFAARGSIVTRDVTSGAETLVLAPVGGNGIALRDPARSPNGKRIAYVRVAAPGGPDAAAELWLATSDGRDPHPSFQRADLMIRHPQWLDDQRLLAIVRSPAGSALERIGAATGERATVIAGALDFGISSDRARIAYVKTASDGGVALFIAAADGTGERPLLDPGQRFAALTSPRFTPDGAAVVFAAPAPGAAADALPDVWAVNVTGGAARRIVALQEPAPSLAFGGDARTLYAVSARSLSAIDVATGAVRRLGDGGDASTLDWFR